VLQIKPQRRSLPGRRLAALAAEGKLFQFDFGHVATDASANSGKFLLGACGRVIFPRHLL
jgi:hypothetical protein